MKNKSTRHKEANTFKFQPFAERISNVSVDIFHRVAHAYETLGDEDEECCFHQAIEKWDVLNLTESYDSFKREVRARQLITLPQLLHNKDTVVEVLAKHLRLKNVLCLQPLLELVVALAKDLRGDFYPYYPEILEILIELLKSNDAEQLEWTFHCLAYLFKFLWRPLIRDINAVFKALLPLLSESYPEYINNFAAESFAFVARKVKDKQSFLELVLKAVKRNSDGISGCGRLLFEVLKGVNGQFHSCADSVLPFLLQSLENEKLPQQELFEILQCLVSHIVTNIHPQKGSLLWTTYLELLQKWTTRPDELDKLLILIGQALEHRQGKFMQDPTDVTKELTKVILLSYLPETVLTNAVKLAVLLLLSRNVKLTQEQASGLTKSILLLKSDEVFLYFVEHATSYTSFEALILPTFLNRCVEHELRDGYLPALTKLVLVKSPLCEDGVKLSSWVKYRLDFGITGNEAVKNFLQNYFNGNIDEFICASVILPHVNITFDVTVLKNRITETCDELKQSTTAETIKEKLFVLQIVLETLVHINGANDLIELKETIVKTVLPLCCDVNYVVALNVLDLFFTAAASLQEVLDRETLEAIHEAVVENFSSPHHKIRLLTSHIYSLFENTVNLKVGDSKEEWNVFGICYRVESIQSQVGTYREQLQLLEKFFADKAQMLMCQETVFKTVPLRYLCGVLYINFQLLWDPVINVIASIAHSLELKDFWEVFLKQLKKVVVCIRTTPVVYEKSFASDFQFVIDLFEGLCKVGDKPDFVNVRLLLWKAMAEFPDIAEARTRDVSDLLLTFVEEEYYKSNSDMAHLWNIKQRAEDTTTEDMDTEENVENDETNRIKKELLKPVVKSGGKSFLKTLLQHLLVFSKVRSPLSMYRERDLHKLYHDLLSHKNPLIQKAAMDCIMTYKPKYLVPYQQNLYGLIDGGNFKNELVAFRVDKESSIIAPEHRDELIPVVMRIVFSKMVAKAGLRTGGKSGGQFRRNLILRFLSGCEENEMLTFVKMAFRYYAKNIRDDVQLMVTDIVDRVDLEKFIPPKRMLSSINLLTVILEQFGNLMGDELLRFLLKVLLCIGASLKAAFDDYMSIHVGYLPILRNLRTTSIMLVERFFCHFENYPWTCSEINAVYDVFIWPYLDKLNIEGIHSPTTLLKLLCLWGSNPRYFKLIVKYNESNITMYPLMHMMTLLLNPKSHITVCNLIMETVEKLLSLTLNHDEPGLDKIDNVLPIQSNILERLKIADNLNYGSCILLPHVPSVLEKIQYKLQSRTKNVNRRELFILSRISELIWEPETSDAVLRLLLPIVLKKCLNAGEETVTQLIATICNLMRNVEHPETHLKEISPLFAYISNASCRKSLCGLLTIMSDNCEARLGENLLLAKDLITELNAYDVKWVDQPDYPARLEAFRKITDIIDNDKMTLELGVLLIYNCYYMISIEKDLSLRENASHCLKNIAPRLIQKFECSQKDTTYVVDDILFTLIRNGFKSKNDDIRNECISLLGCISRECPESHAVLRDLNKLTNKADLEVDFFENLVHLQSHRHGRALHRFSQIFKEQTSCPSVRTLTQFILPLTTHYLCTERFANKHSLIDSAIDAVGTMCRLLPWHQYESILKYYLGKLRYKMEFQRQLVKLVVHILDAFHFDLSKGQVEEQGIREDVKKSKKKGNNNNRISCSKTDLQIAEMGEKEKEVEIRGLDHSQETENLVNETEDLEEISDIVNDNSLQDDIADILMDDTLTAAEEFVSSDEPQKPYDKVTVLCKSAATRVTKVIQMILLPQLHRSLAQMTPNEGAHKANKKRTGFEKEEEDLLRIPVSLAVVKLLQRLPKRILDANLPGVFMKICTFLKSQLESVRRTARDILQKIMTALGPDYLRVLLSEMSALLSKGFQVHVLVYTIHAVLSSLKELYKPTHIDNILLTVINICTTDLFGSLADEREVGKIVSKTSEAKSSKSIDTFQILAQFVTDKCLMDLILPIKTVFSKSHSFKTVNKAQECLRHIALGLVDNEFIQIESLLKFAYGTATESIPQLLNKEKVVSKEKRWLQKTDCLIIPKQPTSRSGFRLNNVKTNAKSNAHVLVEFGIRLCSFLLKRDKLRDEDFRPYIDPFVGIFKNCLTSQHVKLSTVTLQCLQWVLKYDLPSMRENVKEITKLLFGILHKYASAGLSKGDNFDLVVAAFKTMSVLVREVKYHTIEIDQLKILLLYVEQDLHDYEKQAIAFGLLKAIISRKLIVPEIHPIMFKVSELSITSELTHVRLQSRVVFHQYIMEYPLGKTLDKHVNFYLAQLNYEMQSGRESALDMIQSLVNSFPIKILKEFSGTFFITLGARLVNDDVPACRKMAGDCISSMIAKLAKNERDPLFEIILLWLKDRKIAHKRLAAQLCGILITVERESFESRIPDLMPLILLQFGLNDEDDNQPGKFVRLKLEEVNSEEKDRERDHHLYQVLQMVLKLCSQCPVFLKQTQDIENLSVHVQSLLGYPHDWVRLAAAQFLGFVLASLDVEKLSVLLASNEKEEQGFLYSDPVNLVKSLTLDLCAQLQPIDIKSDLAEQVIKNLVFMARVLKNVPMDDKQTINLLWLVKRMRKIVNNEVVENAASITLRTEVFKWAAAIITVIDMQLLKPFLHHLLAPLVREMITTEESNAPLRQLAKEVAGLVKKRIGLEEYTVVLNRLQRQLSVKRAERKRSRTQLAVTDPEAYAKKKIKQNEKKKEAKKKKIGKKKGIVRKKKTVGSDDD